MNREGLKEGFLAFVLLAIPVLPVSLWEMPTGSLANKLVAALTLLVAAWALSLGVIEVLDRKVVKGVVGLAAGVLLLAASTAVGLFEVVGL